MRIISLVFLMVFSVCFIFADEVENPEWDFEEKVVEVWPEEYTAWEEAEVVPPEEEKGPFRVRDRKVEIGFLHLDIGVSNDFITTNDFFRKDVVIDLDDLADGLRLHTGLSLNPIFFNYKNENWGFGIHIGVDVTGDIAISGKLLTVSEAINDKSEVYAAAFAEVAIPAFFKINKLKLKFTPALYYPVAVVIPDISYTYDNSSKTILDINYQVDVYTAFPMEGAFSLTATPGIDFHIGAEFPLSDVLNLQSLFFFLDFDVGLDLFGIPMIPSSMNDYMRFKGQFGSSDPLDIFDHMLDFLGDNADDGEESKIDWEKYYSIEDVIYGENKISVYRPFKMLLWADWRPFENKMVSFIPTIGFSVNSFYVKPGSFEGGIKSRLDLANLFIATLGIGYYDRLWKNTLDMALNFRAFRFDLRLGMQSSDFAKSWSGGGVKVGLGLTFGW